MSIGYQRTKKSASTGGSTSAATIVLLALVSCVYIFYPETESAVRNAMSFLRVL
jgi:hypothetical protein